MGILPVPDLFERAGCSHSTHIHSRIQQRQTMSDFIKTAIAYKQSD
ncbi:MAG: hypothetical protein F6K65_01905 [Moorea sp. SIO3C2]|nr:hypothetical protein [Moorena sp. SIO3C2]